MARFEKSLGRLAAALLVVAVAVFMSCESGAKKAGGGSATGTNEEYKVLDSRSVADGTFSDASKLEKMLNDNAKEGWKVRAIGMLHNTTIILAR